MKKITELHEQKPLTQDQQILIYLQTHHTITPLEALKEIGCFRLAARIHNLKNQGHKISARRVTRQGLFKPCSFNEYRIDS